MSYDRSNGDEAIGKCSNCKTIIHFSKGEAMCKCPRCFNFSNRTLAGAVNDTAQRQGYRPGDNNSLCK